jgi:hypothetical protein
VHICGDVGRETIVPWQGPYVSLFFSASLTHQNVDVNQFSIITELLGTPPDDVIETIASENVGPPSPR